MHIDILLLFVLTLIHTHTYSYHLMPYHLRLCDWFRPDWIWSILRRFIACAQVDGLAPPKHHALEPRFTGWAGSAIAWASSRNASGSARRAASPKYSLLPESKIVYTVVWPPTSDSLKRIQKTTLLWHILPRKASYLQIAVNLGKHEALRSASHQPIPQYNMSNTSYFHMISHVLTYYIHFYVCFWTLGLGIASSLACSALGAWLGSWSCWVSASGQLWHVVTCCDILGLVFLFTILIPSYSFSPPGEGL